MASTAKRQRMIQRAVTSTLSNHGGLFVGFVHTKKHPRIVFKDLRDGSLWAHVYSGSPKTSPERAAKRVADDLLRHFKGVATSRAIPFEGEV